MIKLDFFKNKKIFITGHTGFKGTWLCHILLDSGADIMGYALKPEENENLYELTGLDNKIKSVIGDIRDLEHLNMSFDEFDPEIVIHLAAQPLVRESFKNPVYTYDTNVMGTVNICECVRKSKNVKSFLNVTTDKVYLNMEWDRGYREDDVLDGYDPYSNSKSCSELVTHSYKKSFFDEMNLSVSTARAGNVIGGGDFAKDRIVPDCVRAVCSNENIIVRNPYSIRPYQHVLDPLFAYLLIVKKQYEDKSYSGYYNIGPLDSDCITTGRLADIFCEKWGENAGWIDRYDGGPHEARFLKLDCEKARNVLGWNPVWNVEKAIEKTVDWYKVYEKNGNLTECMKRQIEEFMNE